MRYYTINDNSILIADNEIALTHYYDDVFSLPEDYEDGKYIIGEKEEEIDVLTYETVEEEITVFDENGEPITEKTTVKNPVMIEIEEEISIFDENGNKNGTTTVKKQVQATHKENRTVKILVLNPNFEAEKLLKLKEQKNAENQRKLDIARNSHIFFVNLQGKNCEFDTKDKTQNDLNSASLAIGLGLPWAWTTNNRITLNLTAEDIQTITVAYMTAVNADIEKWTEYDEAIEQVETIEQIKSVVIDYDENT